MKTKRKLGLMSLLLVVLLFVLSACGDSKLPSEFDQKKVEESAANVVDMVNSQDTKGIQEISNEEMKQAMTDNVLSQVFDTVKGFGEYREISKIDLTGIKDKSTNKSIAVAVLKAKYTDKNVIYTISFDTDMKLAGLYLK